MQSGFSRALKSKFFYRYLLIFTIISFVFYNFFYIIKDTLPLFISGILFAYILDKPIRLLEKLKISRGIAAALLVLFVTGILLTSIAFIVPMLGNEITKMIKALPEVMDIIFKKIFPMLEFLKRDIGLFDKTQISGFLSNSVGNVGMFFGRMALNLFNNTASVAHALSFFIVTPVITFYLAKDWSKALRSFKVIFPERARDNVGILFIKIDQALSSYARGQIFVCIILIALYTIMFIAFKFPYAVLVGFFSGIFSFIPYLGSVTALISTIFYAFMFGQPLATIFMVVSIAVIGFLEGQLLVPKFIGEKIGLNPVLMLFFLFSFGKIFGILGVLFSIPLSAVFWILIKEAYDKLFVCKKDINIK